MFKLISKAWAYQAPPPILEERCRQLADPALWSDIKLKDLECLFNRVYWAGLLSVGAVFIIWLIISGIRYMTAGGDEKATAAARRSLTFAIIGFILVVGAYATIQILGTIIGDNLQIPVFRIPE